MAFCIRLKQIPGQYQTYLFLSTDVHFWAGASYSCTWRLFRTDLFRMLIVFPLGNSMAMMLLNYSHFTKTCNKMFVSNVTIRSEFLSLNHWHFQACFLLGTTFIATVSVIFIPETPAFQEVKILLKHYELNFNSLSVTKSKQTSCLFIDHEMRENNRQNSFLTLGTHMKREFVAY